MINPNPTYRCFDGTEYPTLYLAAKHLRAIGCSLEWELQHLFNARLGPDDIVREADKLTRHGFYTRPTVLTGVNAVIQADVFERPVNIPTLGGLLDTWLNVFEETWISGGFHLIPHTTGFDSRFISATVRYLADSKGPDWLGDVLFITWAPEGELTRPILDDIGFGEKHMILVPDTGEDSYAQWLAPDVIAKYAGEPDRYYGGLIAVQMLIEKMYSQMGQVQMLSGSYAHPGLMKKRGYDGIAYTAAKYAGITHDPYWQTAPYYLWYDQRLMSYYKCDIPSDPRPEMVKMLVPGYERFDNYSPQKRHPNKCYNLGDNTRARMLDYYKKSRYYRDMRGPQIEIPKNTLPNGYPEEIGHYIMACLVEEL